MTEESGRRVGGSNALTGRVLVLVLDLRVGGFLRAGHQQSGDIDDSLELAHAVKEIEHRVIGTIKFHLERQFAIKIFAIDTFRRISAEFDTDFIASESIMRIKLSTSLSSGTMRRSISSCCLRLASWRSISARRGL